MLALALGGEVTAVDSAAGKAVRDGRARRWRAQRLKSCHFRRCALAWCKTLAKDESCISFAVFTIETRENCSIVV